MTNSSTTTHTITTTLTPQENTTELLVSYWRRRSQPPNINNNNININNIKPIPLDLVKLMATYSKYTVKFDLNNNGVNIINNRNNQSISFSGNVSSLCMCSKIVQLSHKVTIRLLTEIYRLFGVGFYDKNILAPNISNKICDKIILGRYKNNGTQVVEFPGTFKVCFNILPKILLFFNVF